MKRFLFSACSVALLSLAIPVLGFDDNGKDKGKDPVCRLSVVIGLVEFLEKFHDVLLFSGGENRLNVRQ
jgi:hypothetical protein